MQSEQRSLISKSRITWVTIDEKTLSFLWLTRTEHKVRYSSLRCFYLVIENLWFEVEKHTLISNSLRSSRVAQIVLTYNVFDRHFDRLDLSLYSTMTTTVRTKTSFIYYVMCLEAWFYDYLAPSEVSMNYLHNSSQLRLLRKCTFDVFSSHDH